MKYLFGPVNSRRLGISLGIDLVSHKTCSLNCVYCECGATTVHTARIDEYVPTEEVLREIDEYLGQGPELDVVTFSGSGEPTLHVNIGRIISHIKANYPRYRVVVLTNGTLLWKEEVRRALLPADVVVPSLDAVSPGVFNKILRPAPGITAELAVEGLIEFRKEYRGSLNIEVFLIPGVNDTEEELEKIKRVCLQAAPDLVQLNRLDRPGVENWVGTLAWDRLVAVKEFLGPLPVEIIGKPDMPKHAASGTGEVSDAIMTTLRRRPSTVEDLALLLGLRRVEVIKILEQMRMQGTVRVESMERGEFYHIRAERELP